MGQVDATRWDFTPTTDNHAQALRSGAQNLKEQGHNITPYLSVDNTLLVFDLLDQARQAFAEMSTQSGN